MAAGGIGDVDEAIGSRTGFMAITRVDLDRKAAAFRSRAEEVRTVLETMQDPDARIKMLQLTEFYEKAATHLEGVHILDYSTKEGRTAV